ncbi:EVE domain-containing protein [Sphingomonas sp.]|uniref:EVE domain-containing protein n=1 Tax=Sphingomonas sp. TaxID=28214 RepID=UPI002DD65F9E|nr:EVE domain-containing protein [Sphingomonas sp.]
MAYWLLRSEPDAYSWQDLERDGATEWDGVRNATARIHLKAMGPGDRAIFYHSNTEKACVGVMEITRAWRPDGADEKWASVAVKPVKALPKPVPLADIKAEPRLAELMMLKQSRLSCSKVEPDQWAVLMEMAGA